MRTKTKKSRSREPVKAAGAQSRPESRIRSPEPKVHSPPLTIPAILLEDDAPGLSAIPVLGERFVLGPTLPAGSPAPHVPELPEAYGTGKFTLTARDPHWLYAQWDLTREQQRQHNARSVHHHLVVRVHADAMASQPVAEVHVHPESQHWFIHVKQPGTAYTGELGYYQADRQ